MLIKEYRVTMPLTVDEYRLGQYYLALESSNDGLIQLVKKNFEGKTDLLNGQYTKGIYKRRIHKDAAPKTLGWRFLPKNHFDMIEERWDAYPYCKIVYTNPGFWKDRLFYEIEEMSHPDNGKTENIFQLSPEQLSKREVVYIDIANDPAPAYKGMDPTKFKSKKTNRGPLIGNWQENSNPLMTNYYLFKCKVKCLFGKVFEDLVDSEINEGTIQYHRELFCSIDRWYGLKIEEVIKDYEMFKENDKTIETIKKLD